MCSLTASDQGSVFGNSGHRQEKVRTIREHGVSFLSAEARMNRCAGDGGRYSSIPQAMRPSWSLNL